MKLLLSAYACAPNRGSDYAVGWNWATEAHGLGHEVWVLASSVHRSDIEAACRLDPALNGIQWVFPTIGFWPLEPGVEPKWERTYNLLWQQAAVRHARDLHRQVNFDAIHHATWAGVRAPTFLGTLGPPLIVGPIGGGETSPRLLRSELPLRGKFLELLRDVSNRTITLNPIVRPGFTKAAVIFVQTADTQSLFSGSLRSKTVIFTTPNLQDFPVARPRRVWHEPPKFLYVGRLLYWKGGHIALRAFAELAKHLPGARLTIRGDGPEQPRLVEKVREYGLQEQVDFVSRMPKDKLSELYDNHDLLMFPSLHDAGGFVALEAFSHGMPVVCLDLGGPRDIVTSNSGLVIKVAGRNTVEVVAAMAEEILRLFKSPEKLSELSAGAISRAREFASAQRVKDFYDRAAPFIQAS
jgi:glycosyltransferase involved in cell wall biosynthesis